MKKILIPVLTLLAIVLLAAACGDDRDVNEPTTESASGETIQRLWIGPRLVDCVGAFPQECMLVRYAADGQAEYFYSTIEGFTHVTGTSYVVDVAVGEVDDPPADASSLRYRLVEIIESSNEPAVAALPGTAWSLHGFQDGDLFDAVPADLEVTMHFDQGRVSGRSGCNNYMGTYQGSGNSISFGPIGGTKMLCPEPVMAVEGRFLEILDTVERVELIFDGRLVLSPGTGLSLVFEVS